MGNDLQYRENVSEDHRYEIAGGDSPHRYEIAGGDSPHVQFIIDPEDEDDEEPGDSHVSRCMFKIRVVISRESKLGWVERS